LRLQACTCPLILSQEADQTASRGLNFSFSGLQPFNFDPDLGPSTSVALFDVSVEQ